MNALVTQASAVGDAAADRARPGPATAPAEKDNGNASAARQTASSVQRCCARTGKRSIETGAMRASIHQGY
ncbi:hypothetical protein G6F64_014351 [Rhizopus arrhizus]|uniref:Uncharacterized protein n=1 Tax=Rhizopus oryzae TaxID=64495 RepID=A0A9P6WTK3_RHIOR|nr:hypothetical protein G6F64_014351 [Rhizopus arrhizus]